jgi:hypothetical protein
MSIFTRLNLFIALAIISVIAFVAIDDQNLRLQDKLTTEYRQVARQENTLNRLQANVLEERVALQIFRKTYDNSYLLEAQRREKIVREQLLLAFKLNAAPTATLNKFDTLERQYDKARKGYVQATIQVQAAAQQALNIVHHDHHHTSVLGVLLEDLSESLETLRQLPTENSLIEILDDECERLISLIDKNPDDIEFINELAPLSSALKNITMLVRNT